MPLPDASGRGPAIYRGWWILAASFVNSMLVIGSTIYLFGLMVVPASKDLGLSRAEINQGYIVFMIGMTVWSPFAGWLIDRSNARLIIPVGAALMVCGYAVIAATDRLWLMAIMLFLPVAGGAATAGMITGSALTSRWFRRRRGRAIGIYAMASSVGGLILSPVMATLIENWGWRMALLAIGISIAVIISALGLIVVRDRPGETEIAVEDDPLQSAEAAAAEGRRWTIAALLRERNFYMILFGMGIIYASDQVLLISVVPHMQDKGVALTAASFVIACQSASAICGKLVVGYLAERISIVRIFAVIVVFHLALLALYISWPGYWPVLVASSVIGIAIGGVYPVNLILIAQSFGSTSYAFVLGILTLATQSFSVVALYFTGLSYDASGTYGPAFGAMMIAVCISLLLVRRVQLRNLPGAARQELSPERT
jgi:MFS family permease